MEDVENLGFDTYPEIYDYSYDTEPKVTRMYSAIERNIDTLRQDIDLDIVKEKIDRNFDYLMGDYADSIRHRAAEDLRILFEK